jgi:hypothetical protein
MKRYFLLLPLICIAVVNCIRSFSPQLAEVENDTSIRFPQFFERAPVDVAHPGQTYQLDGVTLRALAIAANDFLPPDHATVPCADRQEAHVYRVIRQGDIIFIRIDENPEHCGRKYGRLDSGAKYAISTDGRILRRALDGMDESMEPFDGGTPMPGEPGVSPNFDPANLQPLPFMPSNPHDGGAIGPLPTSPPCCVIADGGAT